MSKDLGSLPSRLPQADLATAFAPPDRTTALGGKLAPRRTAQVGPKDDPAPAPTPLRPAPPLPVDPPSAPPTDADDITVQTVVVYLPASLRDRVRKRASATALTYTDLTLAAVEDTYPRLADLLAQGRPAIRQGGLFQGAARPRRQRHNEPQVQVSLRPTKSDLATLDRLVTELHAPSRSALVATALDAYLRD